MTLSTAINRSGSGDAGFCEPRIGRRLCAALLAQLLSSASYGNPTWYSNPLIGRYKGPWLLAPIEPGITPGSLPVTTATANRTQTFDYRQDVYLRGDTHFSPVSTVITNSIQFNGGRRVIARGIDANGYKFSWVKVTDQGLFEGILSDMSLTADSDATVCGGHAPTNITSGSITGTLMTVTTVSANTGGFGNSSGLTGDVIPGGGVSGPGVIAGTKIVDYGKASVTGQISGTTLTVSSATGDPLAPGMTIEADGGVIVGTISSGTGPYTITNAGGLAYAAGSRFFIYSTGRAGTYRVDTNHATPTGTIAIVATPPVSSAGLTTAPGPVLLAQFTRVTNGHGTNRTHWTTVNGPTENSALISSAVMNAANTQCTVVLASDPAGGAIPTGATYAGKSVKLWRVKIAGTAAILSAFNRDWTIVSSSGTGATTTLVLAPDVTSVNLPGASVAADINTGTFYLMGTNVPLAAETTAISGGNHTDSAWQLDKDRHHNALLLHNVTATGNYQPDGIKCNSVLSDCVLEESNVNYKWVVGVGSWLDDMQCNISWIGTQSVPTTQTKTIFNGYLDLTARPWVSFVNGPMPNPNSDSAPASNARLYTDPTTGLPALAYAGNYRGGWLNGTPAGGDFCPAGRAGFAFDTSVNGYFGQRDPLASEMTAATYTQDIPDILSIASAGTHIGWIDITAPGFPGALANGSRCIVDLTCDKNFIGVGTSISGRRLVRGRQAVPVGANTFNIIATVRGTAISKSFGPFSITGVTAGSSTLTPTLNTVPAPSASALASYPFTIGTNASGSTADQIVAVLLESSASTPRAIGTVTCGGVNMTLLNYSNVTKSDGGTVAIGWYRLSNVANGANIDVTVATAAGSAQGCAVYSWTCTGLGVIYDVATADGAAAANVPQTVNVATVAGGAVLAIHSFANAASGAARLVSAAQNTAPGANSALSVGGTAIVTSAMTWTGATKINDASVVGSGTGASALSAVSLAPVL